MTRSVECGLLLVLPIAGLTVWAAETNSWPPFSEVYGLVRSNLAGAAEEKLNRAAVEGFLDRLRAQVSLTDARAGSDGPANAPLITQAKVFDDAYGYLRLRRVGAGLAEEIQSSCTPLRATNKLKGLILDLRFADGTDYAAAAQAADRFLPGERALLTWEATTARSTTKTNAIQLPVALLINSQTTGAAEAMAAVLREADVGLLLGTTTAGRAMVFKDFPLQNGQLLRVATTPVYLGEGNTSAISGLVPDIRVQVSGEEEKAFYADAFRGAAHAGDMAGVHRTPAGGNGASGSTNRSIRRLNEAELVRLQKEGEDLEEKLTTSPPPSTVSAKLVVQDPVLARALDLLKGLAVVQRFR